MKRALVGLSGEAGETEMLREAGELAAGVDADLVVLSMVDEDAIDKDRQTLKRVAEAEGTTYDPDAAGTGQADKIGHDVANDALSELDIDYEVVGLVVAPDEKADCIVTAAEEHNCDHLFIIGRQRSPTGKAIFGDVAQRVILNFEGAVTVTTR